MEILRQVFVKDGFNIYLRDKGIIPAYKNIINERSCYSEIDYMSDKEWPENHERITDLHTIEQITKMNKSFKNKKQNIKKNSCNYFDLPLADRNKNNILQLKIIKLIIKIGI